MVINGIDTGDISIVIQGAVDLVATPRCVQAAKNNFPGSEIILSTWKNSNVAEINADKVLFNSDPGGMKCSHAIDNTNRQIISSRNGVNHATKQYILKIRSDCCVKSPKMLNYWNLYPDRDDSFRWFEHRVITPTLYCKRILDCGSKIPIPFHYSDWLQFGLADDIRKIWNIDTTIAKEFSNFYSSQKYTGNKLQRIWLETQYVPESYIFYSGIKKEFPQVTYNGIADYNSENIIQSEQILFNNFILLEPGSIDIVIEKEPYRSIIKNVDAFRKNQPGCYYTERDFKEAYERRMQ